MFYCGDVNCKPCGDAGPKVDTVKVDSALLVLRGKENTVPCCHQEAACCHAEAQADSLREHESRIQAERMEAHRRLLQEEESRLLQQEAERQQRRARELEEERARHRAEEAARRAREEAFQREREQREAEEAARRCQEASEAERQRSEVKRRKVEDFLKANGFSGLNVKRRSMFKSFYPLHAAVSRKDAEMVALLVWAGADGEMRNSSGQTPLQLAQKLNKQASHNAVIQALAGPLH